MDEYKKLQKTNNGITSEKYIESNLKEQYDLIISNIDNLISENKMNPIEALEFKDKIINFCANLLSKDFKDKDNIINYFNKLYEELNIKFLFEYETKQRDKAKETAFLIIITGMVYLKKLDSKLIKKRGNMIEKLGRSTC